VLFVSVLTHAPPQKVSPAAHLHVPLWHVSPPLHVTPHEAVLVLQ
jgi:hypothetical protein